MTRARTRGACLAGVLLGAALGVHATWAADRHARYYYPAPASSEVYEARAAMLPDSSRKRRILFLDLLKLMGFELLTVTDGDRFAHQIHIR